MTPGGRPHQWGSKGSQGDLCVELGHDLGAFQGFWGGREGSPPRPTGPIGGALQGDGHESHAWNQEGIRGRTGAIGLAELRGGKVEVLSEMPHEDERVLLPDLRGEGEWISSSGGVDHSRCGFTCQGEKKRATEGHRGAQRVGYGPRRLVFLDDSYTWPVPDPPERERVKVRHMLSEMGGHATLGIAASTGAAWA